MKKQITISQAGVEFLFSILDTTPANDSKSVSKMHPLLQAMKEPVNATTAFRNETRKKYLKEIDDGKGGKKMDIAKEDEEEFGKELLEGMNKEVTVQFDRESFSYLKTEVIEKAFERNPNLKNGIAGSLHIRLFNEITTAIENAVDVQ